MDPQLLIVLAILGATVLLIVTELVRIDLVAILAMLALAWTGTITPEEARSGFSSNAVWAIVAVMIMSRGITRAGITSRIATFILRISGSGVRRITGTVSATVGLMSGFVQNVGAAALFLPVMKELSRRQEIPVSRLLMPMGFAALLGGSLTMVGTSSLIVLNDLLTARGLPAFGLFHVAPIGLALLVAGIAYFLTAGRRLFPTRSSESGGPPTGGKLLDIWGLSDSIYRLRIPSESSITGMTAEDCRMGANFHLNLLEIRDRKKHENDIFRPIRFEAGQQLIVQGNRDDVDGFAEEFGLELLQAGTKLSSDSENAYVEVVVPARSSLVGQTLREIPLRTRYSAQVVLFFSESEVIEEQIADRPIRPGDTLVLEIKKDHLSLLTDTDDFITVTPIEDEAVQPEKASLAVASFLGAIAAVFLLKLPISIGFLSGAAAMILGGVLSMEEAYRAIDWKVIFLIAGLIPIGIAMETSGAASFIAQALVESLAGVPPFLILLALGVLMTGFTLVMSNVAATVLMVPLVLELVGVGGLTGEVLALQVGLCATNSFILPTHQVNALLMTAGGYRIPDYLRAGGALSVLYLLITTSMLYFLYL